MAKLRLRWGEVDFDNERWLSGTCRDGTPFRLEITRDQIFRWMNGAYVQDVFPELTADQREILITGMSPKQFEELFGEEEPDEV